MKRCADGHKCLKGNCPGDHSWDPLNRWPSLPAERDVVHSLSDTKGSDDTTNPAPAERNEPVTAAGREWLPYLVNRLPDEALPIKYGHVADAISAIEREAAMPSVEALGLSAEQTRNLREHLTARQQTLGEWIGDVMFDFGLGRPDGIDYPPAARLTPPTDTGAER